MSSPTILLVEDNREDVLFFRYAPPKAGFAWNLRVAEDGQKAVDQLSRSATSALSHLLLDLKLPIKSGLEVLEWIRKASGAGADPVIVLTSSDVPSDVERARALGEDAYLIKPLTTNGLIETIRTIAERWKLSPSR